MIVASLNKSTGESLSINIPEHGSEIGLAQALDFEFECIELFEFLKENSDTIEAKKGEYILHLIRCLKVFFGDLVDFFELDGSYVDNVNDKALEQHFQVLKGEFDRSQAFDSLSGIFNLIYHAIKNTKPTIREGQVEFIYKEQSFCFPEIWRDSIFNKVNFKSPSVKQAIEILQVQSNYSQVVKEMNRSDVKLTGWMFTKYLSEMAILLLKPGEVLPTDETAFKMHMTERMSFFEDIDLQTALDVEHWFEQYYASLKEDKENWYYFNNKEPEGPEELEAQEKAKRKNKDASLRIGWKSMIRRLLEIGAFRNQSSNDLESVYNAQFTDAVKIISIDNSQ